MKVSVLIPYYNDREFLPQAIESVLNQTFEDFELILVNHATTDDCREIAHSYTDSRIVHIDMDKNYGAGTGLIMEAFLDKAQGEYIKLFCADDVMKPDCLKILVEYMETHPQKDFAFGDIEHIDKEGKSLNDTWFNNRKHFNINNDEVECLKLFFQGIGFLPYIGSIIKKDVLHSIEIDKSFISLFDMSLWVSILLKGYKIGYLTDIVANYRIHDTQMSSIKNTTKIELCSFFELTKYMEIFYKTDNYKLLKQVFSNNPYLNKIKNITDEDMKFIVCYEIMFNNIQICHIFGYNRLYDMLQNKEKRKYLEEKFNFGIKEFRDIYTTISFEKPFKHNTFSTKFLLYMLLKKIINFVCTKKLRKNSNKQATL